MWKASPVSLPPSTSAYSFAPRARVFLCLQDHRGCPFAGYKAVTVDGERAAGVFGVVKAAGQRSHAPERGHRQHRHYRFGAARNDDVRFPALEKVKAFDDRIVAAGTRRRAGHYRPAGAGLDRNHAAHGVGHGAWHHKRADRPPTLLHHVERPCLDLGNSATAGRHQDADAIPVVFVDCQSGIVKGLPADGDGELGSAVDAARCLAIQVGAGIEPLHLAANVEGHVVRVKIRNPARTGLPRNQVAPESLHVVANGGECSHAGNKDSCHISCSLSRRGGNSTPPLRSLKKGRRRLRPSQITRNRVCLKNRSKP